MIKKSNINWTKLVLIPLIDYLTTSGILLFREKALSLDQLFIYYDLEQLRSLEWTNGREKKASFDFASLNSSSSHNNNNHNNSSLAHRAKKLAVKRNDNSMNVSGAATTTRNGGVVKKSKRRFSMNEDGYEHSGATELVGSCGGEHDPAMFSSLVNVAVGVEDKSPLNKKQFASRYKPAESSQVVESKVRMSQLDARFSQFQSMIRDEKSKGDSFGSRLARTAQPEVIDLTGESETSGGEGGVNVIKSKRKQSVEEKSDKRGSAAGSVENTDADFNTKIEEFLRRMQEEKRKRENFGNKLHEMLDS
jgi:hypothetical protein